MKIAVYIEDGLEQVVITAETDNEAAMLNKIGNGERDVMVRSGSFFETGDGWIRNGTDLTYASPNETDVSLMICCREKAV